MKIKKMNDEECLKVFLEFLATRVSITTGFVQDEDTGNLTHQVLQIVCGEFATVSQPEPLDVPLRVALAPEIGVAVN